MTTYRITVREIGFRTYYVNAPDTWSREEMEDLFWENVYSVQEADEDDCDGDADIAFVDPVEPGDPWEGRGHDLTQPPAPTP